MSEYTELEKHMAEATVKFAAVLGDQGDESLAQNVPDIYLDPVTVRGSTTPQSHLSAVADSQNLHWK